MTVKMIRILFVLACIIMGTVWANYILEALDENEPVNRFAWTALGGIIGAAVAGSVWVLVVLVSQDLYEKLAPFAVSLVVAMGMGYLVAQYIIYWMPEASVSLRVYMSASFVLVFGFVGISFGLTRTSNWMSLLSAVSRGHPEYGSPKVVDTSVLIDGRIADVWAADFIEGTLLVPRFILRELQHIADSSDVLRRAKGRRGLDILKAMQESDKKVNVVVVDDDPEHVHEVDGKLVRVAREYGAKIITNDYNLNKVAQIEGVPVLNVNDLANAVKPAVLPDERMEVKLLKEGKEAYQGVGYLDDGTMVVVDYGRDYVGQTIIAVVTSVLQTAAGRMIFGKLSMELKIVKEGKEANQGVGYLDDGTMVVVDGARDHIGQTAVVVVSSISQSPSGRVILSRLSEIIT